MDLSECANAIGDSFNDITDAGTRIEAALGEGNLTTVGTLTSPWRPADHARLKRRRGCSIARPTDLGPSLHLRALSLSMGRAL